MKSILINCPGGWSHGLDSPERGEGRWAQNLAKVLAKSGRYEVFASSGGSPVWGRGERVNVTLLDEITAKKRSHDVYIDASWWDEKLPLCNAKAYLHVHWSPEARVTKKPLPAQHFLVYVYRAVEPLFMSEANVNRNRTLFLPGAFGDLVLPNPSARRVICTLRGLPTDRAQYVLLYEAVERLRKDFTVPFSWIDHSDYPRPTHPDDHVFAHPGSEPWGIPYCEIMAELRGGGVNVALGGGGSVVDCAMLGIPSVIRADTLGFFIDDVARAYGMSVARDTKVEDLEAAIRRLYTDAVLYEEYTCALQALYADHVDSLVLNRFDGIIGTIL